MAVPGRLRGRRHRRHRLLGDVYGVRGLGNPAPADPVLHPADRQTLLVPLCDISVLLRLGPLAALFMLFYVLCVPIFFLFVLVYPFCIRMNRVLWITTAVFAANLLVQAVLLVLLAFH